MNDLISKEKAYEVLSEYYHHKTEMQHKALKEALDMVPSAELQPTCNQLATSRNQLATDYIRREDAIEVIEKMIEVYWDRKVVLARAWEQIKDLPSADIDLSDYSDRLWRNAYEQGKADAEAERKRGKWVDYPIVDGCLQCSVCGILRFDEANYCPNCGADMRGEDE